MTAAAPRKNVVTDPDLDLREAFADHLLEPGDHGLLGAYYGGGDASVPLLRDYIAKTGAAAVPATCHREYRGFPYGMLGNDSAGDCVEAQVYHGLVHVLKGAGVDVDSLSGEALASLAIALYSKLTGYVPGDESTDQGTDPTDAYRDWRETGLELPDGTHHKILGSAQVLPHDGVNVRRGIYEFDCVGISLAMPLAWQRTREWSGGGDPNNDPDWQPGGWGGHQVLGVAYTSLGVAVITWGGVKILTWKGLGTYGQLVLVGVSKDQVGKGGVSETGLDLSALESDFGTL